MCGTINSIMARIIELECNQCKKIFTRIRSVYERKKRDGCRLVFCSVRCSVKYKKLNRATATMECGFCNKTVVRVRAEFEKSKSGNIFCDRSCAASYNNRNKKTGHRRSKLEAALESYIQQTYPELVMLCNDKSVIGSELDFYFPDLRLAIEINGIFHYEPIYGNDKFEKIKNNDKQKMFACREAGVELAVICTHDGLRISKKRTDMYKEAIDEIIKMSFK